MARIFPVFVPHEGCPHECVFCNQRRIAAPVSPGLEEVRERVCAAVKSGFADEIAFYGGSFTAIPQQRQKELLSCVAGLGVKIRVSTRPDAVDGHVIKRLLDYGVGTVELGAQSMDETVLARSDRGHTAQDTVRSSKLIKNAGIKLILQVMAGLPGDRGTWRETARRTAALSPDGVRIYPVVVLRDTALYDLWRSGEYEPLTVSEGADAAADMLEVFIAGNIPVIRIGLNPTEELSAGSAAAGAYHPAIGEMAKSRIYFRRITGALEGLDYKGRRLIITVAKGHTSQTVGVGRENIRRLTGMGISKVLVREDEKTGAYCAGIILE